MEATPVCDSDPLEMLLQSIKSTASIAHFQSDLQTMKLIRIKGKYLNKMGFNVLGTSFLYPEEALWLVELRQLVIVDDRFDVLSYEDIYRQVILAISLPVYLTFQHLKSLDYIVQRRSESVCSFKDLDDLKEVVLHRPEDRLLDIAAAFEVYLDQPGWTKQAVKQHSVLPVGRVVICDKSTTMLPHRVTWALIQESAPIPVWFSIVSRSGHVSIQELSDAEACLNMRN